MVEYHLIVLALIPGDERYLVAHTKLDKLAYVQMRLGQCLQVDIVAYAILDTETNIVECLIDTHLLRLVEQRTWPSAIDWVVVGI